jgi:hypothetical protein
VSERYRVSSVLGYTIHPGHATSGVGGGSHRTPSRSYAVLDSAVCYRIVAEFITRSGVSEGTNERRARRLCERLNELERG